MPVLRQDRPLNVRSRFTVVAPLDKQASETRLTSLLSAAAVTFRLDADEIRSVSTPVAILGVQSALYSRRNWLGLNPFAFVSSLRASLEPGSTTATTRIDVEINSLRAYVWVAFSSVLGAMVGAALPHPTGWIVWLAATAGSWLLLVQLLAGRLVKAEIVWAVGAPQ